MHFRKLLMGGYVVMIFISCSVSQKTRKNTATVQPGYLAQNDTTNKGGKDSTKPVVLKQYKEVITANAITSRGMFTIHKLNERYFFEIPDSILNKDILLVSRISQGPAGGAAYAGDEIGQSIIRYSRGPGNKLFIRLMSFINHSTDSSANGMYRSVQASNLQPIQAAFDIKTIRPDSAASIIDVTDFLLSDNPLLYLDASDKKALNLGGYQKDRSYITELRAFLLNVELQTVNTYLNNEQPKTLGLNVSFVLLPDQPMHPRYFDKRVGYFMWGYNDYDAPNGVKPIQVISRWRMEPKDGDQEKYLRGELVEPKKPIVYYIDPATPKKWIPYLIQGVNDWQKAFEKAGFKNAIYALEAPTNDSTFSLFDARHNAIVYKASPIANASGPQINDPRTGEILETHVNWYHNIQQLLRNWYMIQAGPNDCDARKMAFDDKLMGQLIRFVVCHEVGHTLGLRHNMGASSTVPTDSLRSKTYLDKNGFCPSIMDYARFNYVAQPEDGLSREEIMPRIGVYDEWAIEWGYRWLPNLQTKEQENVYMDQWVSSQLAKDKRLWWGEFEPGLAMVTDPRCQSEDLGEDAMKASYYGIQNLKRVMNHLTEWTREPGKGYENLSNMYGQVVRQYGLYVMHVANNIGNKYWTEKTPSQPGAVIQFIPKTVQKKAMQFLAKELFETPTWLYDKHIFSVVGGWGEYVYWIYQNQVINWLVNYDNYQTMSFAQMQQPGDCYSYDEFLTDMENEIWKELKGTTPISFPRRNLQLFYTERMIKYSMPNPGKEDDPGEQIKLRCDFYPLIQKHIRTILGKIDKQLPNYKDETTQLHLKEVKKRLQQALNFARFPQANILGSPVSRSSTSTNNLGIETSTFSFPTIDPRKCTSPQGPIKCNYWELFNFQENISINQKQ